MSQPQRTADSPAPSRPVDTIATEFSPTLDQRRALPSPAAPKAGWLDRLCRRGVLQKLSGLRFGRLQLTQGPESYAFGQSGSDVELQGRIDIHQPDFFRRLALGGTLGFAESFIHGDWTTPSLTEVLRVFCRNLHLSDGADRGLARLTRSTARRWHERHENSRDGSAQNIHAHYDLGNDFYALFLDETMTYSSAVFESPETPLRDAQVAKIDRMCRKLDLRPEHHLLEIGTGWGAFAVHAARNYGCRVTTTTISQQQYDFARQRVQDAGLSDRITLLKQDYRDLTGQYDRLVSVEMIEAVGREYFDTFFRKCGELLKPDGQMVLQGITMSEQRYDRYLRSVDFIQRYIFPGGCLITPSAVMHSVARVTDMRLLHLEDLAPHYAQTLRLWRERFFARIDDVRLMGFPDTFIRLWDYYLSYCEAAFLERLVGTVQIQLARPRCLTDALRPFV